jgi:beta-mannanase
LASEWLLPIIPHHDQSRKSVLDPHHPYHTYFYNELGEVAVGLEELKKKGVVVFLNPFAEATADWFWWGGDSTNFVKL